MADRYTGRHIRQARHGAWVTTNKRGRSKPARVAPVAVALAVAGVLIGGSGAVIQLGTPDTTGPVGAASYDAASYPAFERDAAGRGAADRDAAARDAAANRSSRGESRVATPDSTSAATATKQAIKPQPKVVATGSCQASFYDEPQLTANGEQFNPDDLTAASKTLPFNTRVRVTNTSNGESVIVRINDRGPYVTGRCLDLSSAAFAEIASLSRGVVAVRYEVLADAG